MAERDFCGDQLFTAAKHKLSGSTKNKFTSSPNISILGNEISDKSMHIK
jgi:hypothetical protein